MGFTPTITPAKKRTDKRRLHEVSVHQRAGSKIYYYEVMRHGKRHKFSTGQTNRSAAIAQAKILRARVFADDAPALRATMERPGWATVGDCVRVWRERQMTRKREQVVGAVRRFASSLEANWEAVSCDRLTRGAFADFLAAYPGTSEVGRMSTWATVRSMWQPRAMDWYADAKLRMPDMSGLRSVRCERGAGRAVRRFQRIPAATLATMDAAAEALRGGTMQERRVWAAYLLMRRCGLRNSEVAALRWDWIVEGRHSPIIELVERAADLAAGVEAWKPKGTSGAVPIRAEYVSALLVALGDGWVIPRADKADIARVVEGEINAFVRRFLPDRRSGAHELRKQFGAEVAMRSSPDGGLKVATRLLRIPNMSGRAVRRFQRIPAATLATMDAAAEALRGGTMQERRVWAAYLLMRRCGLRNSEVAALRWDWIIEKRHSPIIELVPREADSTTGVEAWKPRGTSGAVPIRTEYLAALRVTLGDGWVIPRENKTDIARVVEREINAFVRRFLPDRQKGAYELRKQFGAEVAMRTPPDGGLEVAARLLRHASVATTWAHYHDLVHEPTPL